MTPHRFSYGLTVVYTLAVLVVYLMVNYLSPDGQLAAILLAIAVLLVITGATLIAVYTLAVDARRRQDYLLNLISVLQAEINAQARVAPPRFSPPKEPPYDDPNPHPLD